MQKLSVGLARSIWLFDTNQLNPSGKNIFPEGFIWLSEKYSFQGFPKTLSDLDQEKKGAHFKRGAFQADKDTIDVNLSIYTDGLIAETWASTEQGDLFLEHVLQSVASRYGLVVPSVIRKQYISELTVRLDHTLSNRDPLIIEFCRTLDKLFERQKLPPFELTGLGFGEDLSRNSYKPPGLIIERKLGVDFGLNEFWSRSPFPTKDHLFALQEFENLMAAMNTRLAATVP